MYCWVKEGKYLLEIRIGESCKRQVGINNIGKGKLLNPFYFSLWYVTIVKTGSFG